MADHQTRAITTQQTAETELGSGVIKSEFAEDNLDSALWACFPLHLVLFQCDAHLSLIVRNSEMNVLTDYFDDSVYLVTSPFITKYSN